MEEVVSVIVPIYNVERYLNKCIDSIINQTYPYLEIILVNDGSTDECGGMCDEYCKRDSRVKVIHKQNGGAADSRNFGLAVATGKYISFVDSDDFIHNKFIEILLSIARDKKADIVVGDFLSFNNGDEVKDILLSNNELNKADVLSDKHLYDDEFVKREIVRFVVPWGKIYKRTLFEGITFPVGRINEDTHTTYKIYEKANKVVYLKEPLYYWRNNIESITRRKFTVKQLSGLDAFIEQLEYYHKVGKQRHIEIVYDEYIKWFFWCYNEMQAAQMDYKKELTPYYKYIRKHVGDVKLTKSVGIKKWVKYRYLLWYKIPKILK